jgi:phage shock protein A
MGIFDRMGRVISGNLNSLLDRAEDDKKLIELNLEEMAEQIKSGRQDVVSAIAAEKQLKKKVLDLTTEQETWEKRAELALKTDDEALAREALKQKKRVSQELDLAEKSRTEQRDVALKMKSELERMEQKLEELRMRKGTIVARAQQARSATGDLGAKGGSSAFQKFKELEDGVEGREAQGAAMDEVEEALGTGKREDLDAKFRELERSMGAGGTGTPSDIDDELAALKKRVRV